MRAGQLGLPSPFSVLDNAVLQPGPGGLLRCASLKQVRRAVVRSLVETGGRVGSWGKKEGQGSENAVHLFT